MNIDDLEIARGTYNFLFPIFVTVQRHLKSLAGTSIEGQGLVNRHANNKSLNRKAGHIMPMIVKVV